MSTTTPPGTKAPMSKRREDLLQRIERIRSTPAEQLSATTPTPTTTQQQPKSKKPKPKRNPPPSTTKSKSPTARSSLPPLKKKEPSLSPFSPTTKASPSSPPAPSSPRVGEDPTWSTFYSSPNRVLPQERLRLRSFLDNNDPVVGLGELSRVKLSTLLRAVRDHLHDRKSSGNTLTVEEKRCLMDVSDYVTCVDLGMPQQATSSLIGTSVSSPRLQPLDTGRRAEKFRRQGTQTDPVKFEGEGSPPPPPSPTDTQESPKKALSKKPAVRTMANQTITLPTLAAAQQTERVTTKTSSTSTITTSTDQSSECLILTPPASTDEVATTTEQERPKSEDDAATETKQTEDDSNGSPNDDKEDRPDGKETKNAEEAPADNTKDEQTKAAEEPPTAADSEKTTHTENAAETKKEKEEASTTPRVARKVNEKEPFATLALLYHSNSRANDGAEFAPLNILVSTVIPSIERISLESLRQQHRSPQQKQRRSVSEAETLDEVAEIFADNIVDAALSQHSNEQQQDDDDDDDKGKALLPSIRVLLLLDDTSQQSRGGETTLPALSLLVDTFESGQAN